MSYITFVELMKQLGIAEKKSVTLESMTKDEILNMTPEQAKKICEEVGEGWNRSIDYEPIEFFGKTDMSPDGTIEITFKFKLD